MFRPPLLIGVIGTHTEVGKTWILSRAIAALRARGLSVAVRKPVQSFAVGQGSTDAELLAAASREPVTAVCPAYRCYEIPMAPPMAADALGRPRIQLQDLLAEITWPAALDIGFVETVGGARSPLAHDADSLDLVLGLRADLIWLIADAGLGTINAVRLTHAALSGLRHTVVLNRFDASQELHRLNRAWLADHYGIDIVSTIEELVATVT